MIERLKRVLGMKEEEIKVKEFTEQWEKTWSDMPKLELRWAWEDKYDELLERIEKLEKEIEVLKERLDRVTNYYKATITSWGGEQ